MFYLFVFLLSLCLIFVISVAEREFPSDGCQALVHGCCADLKTPKVDEIGSNCPVFIASGESDDKIRNIIGGCVSTRYGCCADLLTAKVDDAGSNCGQFIAVPLSSSSLGMNAYRSYFVNLHDEFVPSVVCKRDVDDADVSITSGQMSYPENVTGLPLVPDGLYHSVYVYGEITGSIPTYYEFHYEMFVVCPKCTDLVNKGYLCKTEYPSIRSTHQKEGRINPVLNTSTTPVSLTIHALFNLTASELLVCGNIPQIVVKRVAKNNDKAIYGCDTLSLVDQPTHHPTTYSIPSGSNTFAPTQYYPGCFAGSETVSLQDGSLKTIDSVVVGDVVLSADSYGKVSYQAVVSVPHAKNDISTEFVHFTTADGLDLTLTSDHLLPYGPCSSDPLVYEIHDAGSLEVGLCVRTVRGTREVLSVERLLGMGLYSAIVNNEFLVLNGGILASAYNRNHQLAKAFYSIYRLAYYLVPGVVSSPLFSWLHFFPSRLDFIGRFIPSSIF